MSILQSDLQKDFITSPDVTNNESGFKELENWIRAHTLSSIPLVIVMEATGVYHQSISYYLHNKGYSVCILQSGRVKKYAQSLDQRSKTDALDSKMLSMLGCERNLTPWEPPSKTLQELKLLSRERSSLVKDRSQSRNKVSALKSASHIHQKSITRYKRRISLMDKQILEIETEMHQLISKDEYLTEKIEYLESIPGVSFICASTVIAETLGFTLFHNAKQVVSYCGYDVVLRESGNYKGKTKISKKGNKQIRAVLHMPSMTAIRRNPTLKPFYNRLKPNKVKPIIALVAVQRKMLILMYSLWKNNSFYDAKHEIKKAAKTEVLAAQDSCKISLAAS